MAEEGERVIIFDTETSGLVDNHLTPQERQPEIIELCAIDVDLATGEILSEFNELIKPARPISDEITKITHITNEMLKDKPPFSFFKDDIKQRFEKANGVLAHNLSFDMELMNIEYERLGDKLIWPRRRVCSVEQTVHLRGFRLSLTMLHELLFNERFPEAHRAKTDVMALVRCAVELHKRDEI